MMSYILHCWLPEIFPVLRMEHCVPGKKSVRLVLGFSFFPVGKPGGSEWDLSLNGYL